MAVELNNLLSELQTVPLIMYEVANVWGNVLDRKSVCLQSKLGTGSTAHLGFRNLVKNIVTQCGCLYVLFSEVEVVTLALF